ncbi:DUF3817 domain-containing protein [Phytoactinopolyspora halotolerans]|uniref:DUF3817 domain-containing protein n=1 Tax=Phytoactinopolyspora halotolerans TaxID=1981512 RepID=A0A6L9S446_9ACTN|nr:DUF3817 domain-containing protein [Phytoactinopolyspora halotolerans]NED99413.1 DUF3817 domain-containing protein [Phytoactinopolyspora halotolerans]
MNPRIAFRSIAIIEAVTWLGLIIGMIVKYGPADNEIGVTIFGPIHGVAFIIYVLVVVGLFRRFRWRFGTTALALAAAVPPFCTVLFDVWAERTGRLDAAAPERASTG